MHVRGLPALHDGLSHDLQVRVGLIVTGASVVPGRLAVLSLGEDGLSGGGHVVWVVETGAGNKSALLIDLTDRVPAQKRVEGADPRFICG